MAQPMPGKVIDRDAMRGWKASAWMDTFTGPKLRVQEIFTSYRRPELDAAKVEALHAYGFDLARKAGMETLPMHHLSPAVV